MIQDKMSDSTLEYLSRPDGPRWGKTSPHQTGLAIHTYRDGQWVDVDIADATDEDLETFVRVYPKLTARWVIILTRYIREHLSGNKTG